MSIMSTNNFSEACGTYKLLREMGYPEKATLKLVGDRHNLSRTQRNCLFRGVIVRRMAAERVKRVVTPPVAAGMSLGLDWYNVLITVESYLKGQVLFICDDGMLRDASATHGSYRATPQTGRAMVEIVAEVSRLEPSRVDVFLDMPIAFSGLMAEDVRSRLASLAFASEVVLVPSADFPLKAYGGTVATSDSAILDSCVQALDLARLVLERRFGFNPPAVHELFAGFPGSPQQ